jgi:hypothetical protein
MKSIHEIVFWKDWGRALLAKFVYQIISTKYMYVCCEDLMV